MTRGDNRTSVLLISIDSGSVGVSHALVLPHTQQRTSAPLVWPTITDTKKVTFGISDDPTPSRYLDTACKALDNALTPISPSSDTTPAHLLVVLGAPWTITQTRTILFRKATSFIVTKRMVDDFIAKEIAYMMNHDMDQFKTLGTESTIIEQHITAILLNGYETTKPFGKKATSISITLTITLSPKAVITQFTETIHRHYGVRRLRFASTTMAHFVVARDYGVHTMHESVEDFFIVDMSEDITDIIFAKQNTLLYHQTIALGTHSLTQQLNTIRNGNIAETDALITAYKKDALDAPQKALVSNALTQFQTMWTKQVDAVFDTHVFGLCAPKNGIVITEDVWSDIIKTSLENDQFLAHTAGVPSLTVTTILPETIVTSIDPKGQSARCAAAALFMSQLL